MSPARVRVPLLRRGAHARGLDRHAPHLAPDRLRVAARDAGLHRPRDRCEPGRGDQGAGTRPSAQPLLWDRARRRDLRRDRARRALGLPGAGRHHGARNGLAASAADGDRRRARPAPPRRSRHRAPHVRRSHGRGHPAGRRHDLDVGLHAPRPLARRARPAPARVRAFEPAHARIAAGDRRRGAHLVGAHDRHLVHQGRRGVPRQPLQLRRPGGVHGGPAGRDQAPLQRARAPAPLPGAGERSRPRRRGPAPGDRRLGRHLRDLGRRDGHARRRPLRRPGLAPCRPRRLRPRAQGRGEVSSSVEGPRSTCPRRNSAASSCR